MSAVERKQGDRESTISQHSRAMVEEIGKQPPLLMALGSQTQLTHPHLKAFNAWAIDTYKSDGLQREVISPDSATHIVGPYLKWRYQLLGDIQTETRTDHILSSSAMTFSLEGTLGSRSKVNHFDVFLLNRHGGLEFYSHFHQSLNMQLLLSLSNPACDALVFQGSDGRMSRARFERGIDFVVPAVSGVTEIPQVARWQLMRSAINL